MPSAGMDTRMRGYDTWEVMADLIWSGVYAFAFYGYPHARV